MALKMEIRGYRNIPYRSPLEFEIANDICFFVGLNNAGKTNILKLFVELRPVIHEVCEGTLQGVVKLGVPFDAMVHQGSLEREVSIVVSKDEKSMEVTLTPMKHEPPADHCNMAVGFTGFQDDRDRHGFLGLLRDLFIRSMYVPPFRYATVNTATAQHRDIYVGGGLIKTFDEWTAGHDVIKRRKIRAFVDELRGLFGFKSFGIHASTDRTQLLVNTDDGTFRLDELGDGIGHFIVTLSNVLFKNPTYVMIDEPESGLHPRMQQTFVRALAAKTQHGLLATSHSIGLARSVGDRIYTLQKDDAGAVNIRPFGENYKPTVAQSLHELSYSQFADIGGNNILLVEGSTDIKSFREILRIYGIEHRYIIWHLNGGDLMQPGHADELNEIKRLNPKSVAVIFDSGRTAPQQPLEAKLEAFKSTCEKLGFLVHPTDYHSTENYITQAAIDTILGEKQYKALTPYENFNKRQPRWSKSQNWLMFREMTKADIDATDLGKFIAEKLVPTSA